MPHLYRSKTTASGNPLLQKNLLCLSYMLQLEMFFQAVLFTTFSCCVSALSMSLSGIAPLCFKSSCVLVAQVWLTDIKAVIRTPHECLFFHFYRIGLLNRNCTTTTNLVLGLCGVAPVTWMSHILWTYCLPIGDRGCHFYCAAKESITFVKLHLTASAA